MNLPYLPAKKRHFALISLILLAFAAHQEARAGSGGVFVNLPCADPKTGKGKGLLPECSALQKQVKVDLTRAIDRKLRCFYQQKDVDVTKLTDDGTAGCAQGTHDFETPCNLAQGEEKQPSKDTFSPNFSSCGKASYVKKGKVWASGTVGTLERSYYHGAFVQALRSCRSAVLGELRDKRGFDGASCGKSAAADYTANIGAMISASDTLVQVGALSESKSIESVCAAEGVKDDDGAGDPKHRMAVCHLSAARAHVNAMFTQIAQCEIIARWRRVWNTGYGQLTERLASDLTNYCMDKARNEVPAKTYGVCFIYCKKVQNPSEIEKKFNACYQENIARVFKTQIQQLFPEDGSGCGPLGGT